MVRLMQLSCWRASYRPCLTTGAEENREMTTPAETPATESTSVLLADSSWMIRTAIRGVLEGGGFKVVGDAGDAETALALAAEHQPGLVVLGEGLFDRVPAVPVQIQGQPSAAPSCGRLLTPRCWCWPTRWIRTGREQWPRRARWATSRWTPDRTPCSLSPAQ